MMVQQQGGGEDTVNSAGSRNGNKKMQQDGGYGRGRGRYHGGRQYSQQQYPQQQRGAHHYATRYNDQQYQHQGGRSHHMNGNTGGGPGDMRQLSMALSQAQDGTGEVAEILMKATFRPRLPGLTKLVSKLSKDGSWKKALEFFEAAVNLGFEPDTALTNAAISACDKGGKWKKALQIFDQMDLLNIPRDAITYSATISALAKGKQWQGALYVFQHMQSTSIEADVVTCCSLINALERGGQWELAEKLFLEMCTVPTDDSSLLEGNEPKGLKSFYNMYNSPTSVLKAVVRHSSGLPPADLPNVAEERKMLAEEFGSLGIVCSPNESSQYDMWNGSTMVGNLPEKFAAFTPEVTDSPSHVSHSSDTPSSVQRKESIGSIESGVSPLIIDGVHLNSLYGSGSQFHQGGSSVLGETVAALVGQQNPLRRSISCHPDLHPEDTLYQRDAVPVFNFSHASMVAPNRVCCNALLAAYARARPTQWKKAVVLLESMWEGDPQLHPDIVSYNTVFKACANSFQFKQMEGLYLEMNEKGVVPNSTTLNCLIVAATESRNGAFLNQVIEWTERDHPDLLLSCASCFIVACMRCDTYGEGLRIFEQGMSLGMSSQIGSSCNSIFGYLLRKNEFDEVVRVLSLMYDHGYLPPNTMCTSLLECLANQGRWKECIQLLDKMLSSNNDASSIDIKSVNAVLKSIANTVEQEDDSMKTLQASAALQILKAINSTLSVSPNEETYHYLIKTCELAGQHAHALACYDLMKATNLIPDKGTMNYILSAGLNSGEVGRSTHGIVTLLVHGIDVERDVIFQAFHACLKEKEWKWGVQLCEAAYLSPNTSNAGVQMYHTIARECFRAGEHEISLEIVSSMQKEGIDIDPMFLAQVIGSNAAAGNSSAFGNDRSKGLLFATEQPTVTVEYKSNKHGTPSAEGLDSEVSADLQRYKTSPIMRSVSLKTEVEGDQGGSIYTTRGLIEQISGGHIPPRMVEHLKSSGSMQCNHDSVINLIEVAMADCEVFLAIKICQEGRSLGFLSFFSVPTALDALHGSNFEDSKWSETVILEHVSPTVSVVVVAAWLNDVKQAIDWGHVIPSKFENFVICCKAIDMESMHHITTEIVRLITTGHSRFLNSPQAFPHVKSHKYVTIYQEDEVNCRIEVSIDGICSLSYEA